MPLLFLETAIAVSMAAMAAVSMRRQWPPSSCFSPDFSCTRRLTLCSPRPVVPLCFERERQHSLRPIDVLEPGRLDRLLLPLSFQTDGRQYCATGPQRPCYGVKPEIPSTTPPPTTTPPPPPPPPPPPLTARPAPYMWTQVVRATWPLALLLAVGFSAWSALRLWRRAAQRRKQEQPLAARVFQSDAGSSGHTAFGHFIIYIYMLYTGRRIIYLYGAAHAWPFGPPHPGPGE